MIEVLGAWDYEEGKCFALCCVMSCFAEPLALTSLAHCFFSFFVVILFLFLGDHFSYGPFCQAGQAPSSHCCDKCFSVLAIRLVTRRSGWNVDDGSCSYPRVGYRRSSFRRGAFSLLSRRSSSDAHKKISRVPLIAPGIALPVSLLRGSSVNVRSCFESSHRE
jgi:hypothetical protein